MLVLASVQGAGGRLAGAANLASTVTRHAVTTTRSVLSRLGTERAVEVVQKNKAGSYSGLWLLDHGLARLGYVSKTLGFVDNFAAWMAGEHEVAWGGYNLI